MWPQIHSICHTCHRCPQLAAAKAPAQLGLPRLHAPVLAPSSHPAPQRRRVSRAAGAAPDTIRIPEAPAKSPLYAAKADKYAIVEIGGHQMFVEEGRWYTVNRLVAEPGSKIQLRRVIGCKSNGRFVCGQPFLDNVTVEADVIEDLKGPKVTIFKYRAKKHYRKKTGHRQPLTKFLVTKIQSA